jgi:hypothetical protein
VAVKREEVKNERCVMTKIITGYYKDSIDKPKVG